MSKLVSFLQNAPANCGSLQTDLFERAIVANCATQAGTFASAIKKKHNTKTDMQPIRTGDDCPCVGGNERNGRDRHKPSLGKEFQ